MGRVEEIHVKVESCTCSSLNVLHISFSFNFSTTIRELAKEVARESTDGNAPSKSGPTSFSGTTRRVVTRGGKLVKPVRPSWSPRQAKKRRARAVAGKTSVTERRDAGLRPDEIGTVHTYCTFPFTHSHSRSHIPIHTYCSCCQVIPGAGGSALLR